MAAGAMQGGVDVAQWALGAVGSAAGACGALDLVAAPASGGGLAITGAVRTRLAASCTGKQKIHDG
jgi:hypothetical protein